MSRTPALLIGVILAVAAAGGASAFAAGSVDGSNLDFGRVAVGDTKTHADTLTNTSGGDVDIASITVSGNGFGKAGDDCPGTLSAGQQCTVTVSYGPGAAGADSGTLTIDEGAAGTDSFSLAGTGVAHRFLFTNQPGNPDFGNVAVGDTSGAKQITVTNNTDYPDNPSVHLAGSDPGQFNEADNCGTNVANSCDATVTFQPASLGGKSATLQIDGDSFGFSGTGVDPVVVQPLSLSFGDQHVGTNSAAQPVTVTNNQGQAMGVNVGGTHPNYTVNASDCTGSQLQAQHSCTIQVVFSPNSIGSKAETLTVEGQTVQLAGRGTAAMADVSPGSISFGNQPVFTQSGPQNVTVTNTGNESMVVGAPTLSGTNFAQFAISDTCQASTPLAPGASCTVTVTFAPTLAQQDDAVVAINTNATNGTPTVQLHGTGTPSAVVFAPGPVPFKRPHHAGTFSRPKTVTLTNRTSGPFAISSVHLTGSNPRSFRITAGNCAGRTLAADASCTETVRFAPNEVGVKAASLTVTDDGPNSPHSVALTGTATYPRDDIAVHGAAGCDATKITWRRGGTSRRFDRTVIVRSRTHIPTGPNDGTRVPHGAGVLHDRGLRHFTAYEYRVFALYRSRTRPGTLNHSRGVILRLRTGELCTPMDGGVISDTTPTASWLKHPTLFGYSFRLFHAGEEVLQKRSLHATSFTFSGRHRLRRGFTYTLFLYAYPKSQPEGTAIGRTTFRVR